MEHGKGPALAVALGNAVIHKAAIIQLAKLPRLLFVVTVRMGRGPTDRGGWRSSLMTVKWEGILTWITSGGKSLDLQTSAGK
jgi:hypothetical protein